MRPIETVMSPKNIKILGITAIVLIIGAICMRLALKDPPKPPPSAPGYYTGPMRSKGNPNSIATEDGKIVQLPPLDESKLDTKTPDTSPKKTDSAASTDALP